jgi:chemotaxis receptor (MCP) glutamine deamidase CheD
LNVVAWSLGGTSGLTIQFHTSTGDVLLRRLNPMVSEDIVEK